MPPPRRLPRNRHAGHWGSDNAVQTSGYGRRSGSASSSRNLFGARKDAQPQVQRRGSEELGSFAFIENTGSGYRGESVGLMHFFTQFPDVIFRCSGSVLPKIAIELTLAFCLGCAARR